MKNVRMYHGCKEFTAACDLASSVLGKTILPTRRQWRKWLRKTGSAWKHGQLPF